MGPLIILTALVAAINLFVFIAIRGRWGRMVPLLAVASILGALAGNALGERTGLEPLRVGEFHLVTASLLAQLAMLSVVLLAAAWPAVREE